MLFLSKIFSVTCLLFILVHSRAAGDLISFNEIWEFDNNLTGENGGGSTFSLVGAAESYVNTTIGGQFATVIRLPAFVNSTQRAEVSHSLGTINDWTVVMDINIPNLNAFSSLLSTGNTLSDDVEFFVQADGEIDSGFVDPFHASGTFAENTWYRIAIRRTIGITGLDLFIDGVKGATQNGFGTGDPDFRIDSIFWPFSDNSGDTSLTLVNSLGFWSETLTDTEITSLGGVAAQGLSGTILGTSTAVPEPHFYLVCFFAVIGLSRMARACKYSLTGWWSLRSRQHLAPKRVRSLSWTHTKVSRLTALTQLAYEVLYAFASEGLRSSERRVSERFQGKNDSGSGGALPPWVTQTSRYQRRGLIFH